MLRTALGPAVDRLSNGLSDTGERLSAADGERIVRLVAHHVGAEVHDRHPRVSAELPETGERIEGLLPPVVTAPVFAIRKPAVAVFTLDDYVAAGIKTADQAVILRQAVAARANILVAGGTSTGKTTLTNALLVIVTGLTLAFGDTSGGFRRLIQIVFGLPIAFAASSFFLSFFSFGGGALV